MKIQLPDELFCPARRPESHVFQQAAFFFSQHDLGSYGALLVGTDDQKIAIA